MKSHRTSQNAALKPGILLALLSSLAAPAMAQQPLTLGDAIRSTLTQHPALRIQQEQVNLQAGAVRQAAGQFDTTLAADGSHAHAYRPLTAYEEFLYDPYDNANLLNASTNTSQIVLGASKQYRNGILLTPTIRATRIADNITNRGGVSVGSVDFSITLPLLRGRGRAAADSQEMSAARQLDAARFEVNETITSLLATVAASYWRAVAAAKQLDVLRQSESRAQVLLDNTGSLIDADRLPKSDIHQVDANKSIRTANRLAGEQQLLEARQQLAVDMGLDANAVESLPELADTFPTELTEDQIPSDAAALREYTKEALANRPELRALQSRQQAATIASAAAMTLVKPQLDVTVGAGASGLFEGSRIDEFFLSPLHSARGLDLSGAITYRFPLARDASRGAVQQAVAAKHQSDLQYSDMARRTAAAVGPALAGVRSEALQLRNTRLSVAAYRESLDAERERLRAGASSVINVVNLEDQLVHVLQTEVQAELEYALQLVNLRAATSTIISATDKGGSVDPVIFTVLPSLSGNTTSAPAPGGGTRVFSDGSKP